MDRLLPLQNYEDLLDLAIQRCRENESQFSGSSSLSVNGVPLFKDITPRKRKKIEVKEDDANQKLVTEILGECERTTESLSQSSRKVRVCVDSIQETMDSINSNVQNYHDAVEKLNQTATRISQRESARLEKERSASNGRGRGLNRRTNTLEIGLPTLRALSSQKKQLTKRNSEKMSESDFAKLPELAPSKSKKEKVSAQHRNIQINAL